MIDIQQVRELADRRAAEDALIRQLPQLETQARLQANASDAADQIPQLEYKLDSALPGFLAQRDDTEIHLREWLTQGRSILQRRAELAQRGRDIFAIAEDLAEKKFLAGIVRSQLAREDAKRGQAQEEIRERTGAFHLMPISPLEARLGEILDAYAAPPNPPAYYPMPEIVNRRNA